MEMKTKGFTLIEMVVAIGILGTVGMVASLIFFSTLRGVAKTDITREVKQNGDYAITVMERMIRNAAGIDSSTVCNGTSLSSLKIQNTDGNSTTFSLVSGQIASGSGIFLTNPKVSVTNLVFTCSRAVGKPDVINISFNAAQAGSAGGPEGLSSMNFQTTVSLRTY